MVRCHVRNYDRHAYDVLCPYKKELVITMAQRLVSFLSARVRYLTGIGHGCELVLDVLQCIHRLHKLESLGSLQALFLENYVNIAGSF